MTQATPEATIDAGGGNPRLVSRALTTGLALAAVVAIAVASIAWLASESERFAMSWLLVGVWFVVSLILTRVFGHTPYRRLGVVAGVFLFVILLFEVQLAVMDAALRKWPPPRPMFHNYFGIMFWSLLPTWGSAESVPMPYKVNDNPPMLDKMGNMAWADHDDNVIVVVVGASVNNQANYPETGQAETKFWAGPFGLEKPHPAVTVQRTSDRLIVIRPDGAVRSYALRPAQPKSFTSHIHIRGMTPRSRTTWRRT